jgi:TrmH family RNA methyltransferase
MYEIAKFNMVRVSQKVFKSITDLTTPQGILAIVEKNDMSSIDYKQNFFLILDDIQDPGNIGTILRTADSINIKQIIVSSKTADVYNPKVVRSTMGAIFRVKVIVKEDLEKTVKELKKHKIKVLATDLKTDESIYDINYNKTAVIIGNESKGVSEKLLNISDGRIKIPMTGKTESLNAAVASSIIMYEKLRQDLYKK